MNKLKGILIMILAVLIGVFGYLYLSGKYELSFPFKKVSDETAGWKEFTGATAYGDQYTFSIKYPKEWILSNSIRGGYELALDDCKIMAGSGGKGLEGAQIIKEDSIMVNGVSGVTETYVWPDNPNQEYTFSSLDKNNISYIFELSNPNKNKKCSDDFVGIVNTLEAK